MENTNLREGIKEFSEWPTIPQLYIKSEFIGGCDIVKEMYESGELQKKLEEKKYILGYHARVNFEQLQKAHVAFVQVVLSDTRINSLENFNREVNKLKVKYTIAIINIISISCPT